MTIRPPDPTIRGATLSYSSCASSEAIRRLLHLAYRDCTSVLDLTYGDGGFWRDPLPPGIVLAANRHPYREVDESVRESWDIDYTDPTQVGRLPAFDLVVFDPPHVADAGDGGLYKARYGTVKGSEALEDMIRLGVAAAASVARLGVLVKVTDHAHGGEWLPLSAWTLAEASLHGMGLYCALHTYRPVATVDPKWRVQRVPRSNGATYLCYRLDSARHRDFDREYARQERSHA